MRARRDGPRPRRATRSRCSTSTATPADEGEVCLDLARASARADDGLPSTTPSDTADVMRDGHYHTGDVARRDADGYLTYVGRTDDVFKAADYRISPFELESVLIEHEAVAEAAVVRQPRSRARRGAQGVRAARRQSASRDEATWPRASSSTAAAASRPTSASAASSSAELPKTDQRQDPPRRAAHGRAGARRRARRATPASGGRRISQRSRADARGVPARRVGHARGARGRAVSTCSPRCARPSPSRGCRRSTAGS